MNTYHRRWIEDLQRSWDDVVDHDHLAGSSGSNPPVGATRGTGGVAARAADGWIPDAAPCPGPPTLRSVHDLVDWAADTPDVGSLDWVDVWHLTPSGEVTCQCESCACSSLLGWAADPTPLLQLRYGGLDRTACGDDWLIVDSRTSRSGTCIPPCEADSFAFGHLRDELEGVGVTLLDAVVFDDGGHWWSMRELTTGSAAWPEPRSG